MTTKAVSAAQKLKKLVSRTRRRPLQLSESQQQDIHETLLTLEEASPPATLDADICNELQSVLMSISLLTDLPGDDQYSFKSRARRISLLYNDIRLERVCSNEFLQEREPSGFGNVDADGDSLMLDDSPKVCSRMLCEWIFASVATASASPRQPIFSAT